MGYETKIYAGDLPLRRIEKNVERHWMEVMGMLDCCKLGWDFGIPNEVMAKGIPIYIFGSDGDTKITHDKYGASLVAIPIKSVIEALKKILTTDKYARAQWAYDALRSMKKKRKGYHGKYATHCVLFGY